MSLPCRPALIVSALVRAKGRSFGERRRNACDVHSFIGQISNYAGHGQTLGRRRFGSVGLLFERLGFAI
jgi:hypothetical protein